MAQTLTREQIEDLQAKGVYTPEQASAAIVKSDAFKASPSIPETNNGFSADKVDNWVAKGSMTPEEGAKFKADKGVSNSNTAANRAVPSASAPVPATLPSPTVTPDVIPASIAAPNATGPLAAPVTFNPAGTNVAPSGNGSPTVPGISVPGANYTGDLKANMDASLNPILAKRAEIEEAVAAGRMNPADAAKQTAALDVAEHKIKSQYPLNGDGSVNWSGIKPGQFSGKQLGIFQAGDQLRSANKQTDLADQRIEAAKSILEAESARNTAIAKINEGTTSMIENSQELNKIHEQEFNTGLKEIENKLETTKNDFKNAHIDPARYWKQTPTAGLIGIALFAGLEQGFKGLAARGGPVSPSSIVQTVNTLVERDIDAQKEEIAKLGKEVDLATNAVAYFRSKRMDERSAEAAALNLGLTKAAQQVQTVLSQTEDPIAKAKGQDVLLGLEQQKEAARQAAMGPAVAALSKLLAPTPTGPAAGGFAIKRDKDGNYYKVDIKGNVIGLASPAEIKSTEEVRKLRNETDNPKADKLSTDLVAIDPFTGEEVVFKSEKDREAFNSVATGFSEGGKKLDRVVDTGIAILPGTRAKQKLDLLGGAYAVTKAAHPNESTSEPEVKAVSENLAPGLFAGTSGAEQAKKDLQSAYDKAKAKGKVQK